MTGVASSTCFQPTGGEAGGEIRNCLSGFGGARWELPMCSVWERKGQAMQQPQCCSKRRSTAWKVAQRASGLGFWGAPRTGAPRSSGSESEGEWTETVCV